MGYVGMVLTILGAIFLSVRFARVSTEGLGKIFLMAVLIAIGELFIKIAATNMPVWESVSLHVLASGATLIPLAFWKKEETAKEAKNWPWALCSYSIFLIALGVFYTAMGKLPATIVASLSSLQPLAVLLYERVLSSYYGKMVKDRLLTSKLWSISLIVLGVILLSLS